MQVPEITVALGQVAQAQRQFTETAKQWRETFDKTMKRLVYEAAANRLSVEDVSRASNLSPSRVRSIMRANHLNPKMGKNLLAQTASEALRGNAELLGITPDQMDLMSPLAYLPAGSVLRQAVTDNVLAGSVVTALPETLAEDGTWCLGCRLFEDIDFHNSMCRACGCALSDHVDAKVVME